MKQVNFITTLSIQKQYALRRWFLMSVLLSVITFAILLFFLVPELLTYFSLKQEIVLLHAQTKQYTEQTKQRDIVKKDYEQMRIQSSKIDTFTNGPKNPHAYIAAIAQAGGNGVVLESINIHKKNGDITILCPTAEHATVFVKRLSASELFSGVKLVSLQHDNQTRQLRCVIKTKLI
ncbi:MAG TPA: hypothetical protein VKU36_00695 [Candidatus Babeliales bacterium]|nr:hypothetical protein [Candidatus Babeliales bacterium]